MKKYFPYSITSAKAQLKSEVANSYLNWIWWLLDPVCFMFIYTFIFGYVFEARELYFPVFIFVGLSMWDFFNRTVNQSVKIVKNNKAIVTKVYMPKYVLILTKLWVNGFKMAISFGLVILMMIFYRVPISWNVLLFIPIIITLILFTFACAVHLLHFGVYVEDLSNVITIVLRFVFYITGIFYSVAGKVPAPYGEWLNRYNPLAFLLTSMREALIYKTTPDWRLLLFWFAVSVLIGWWGVRRIYKEENSYVKVI